MSTGKCTTNQRCTTALYRGKRQVNKRDRGTGTKKNESNQKPREKQIDQSEEKQKTSKKMVKKEVKIKGLKPQRTFASKTLWFK